MIVIIVIVPFVKVVFFQMQHVGGYAAWDSLLLRGKHFSAKHEVNYIVPYAYKEIYLLE